MFQPDLSDLLFHKYKTRNVLNTSVIDKNYMVMKCR